MLYSGMAIILSTQLLLSGGNVIPCPPSPHTNSNHEVYMGVATFLQITTLRPLMISLRLGPRLKQSHDDILTTWLQLIGSGEAT